MFGQQTQQTGGLFQSQPGGLFGQPAAAPVGNNNIFGGQSSGGFGSQPFGVQQEAPGFGNTLQQQSTNPHQSYEVPNPPSDTVSAISWSPFDLFLAVASWDKSVRVYQVATSPRAPMFDAKMVTGYDHSAPVLCVCWNEDNTMLFSGSADGDVKAYSVRHKQAVSLGKHDAGTRHVFWVKDLGTLVSGGWDRKLKYWKVNPPQLAHEVQLSERVYAMDVKYPVMIVGTADRQVYIFNLQQPHKAHKQMSMPHLKCQTRCLSIFPDKLGFTAGSVEGRCVVVWFTETNTKKNFAFKCHRVTPAGCQQGTNDDIYPVQDIDFHPRHGTFVTVGSDGTIVFWDKENKTRLKNMEPLGAPVVCCSFSSDGNIFAYASGYDWHKGHQSHNNCPNKLLIMRVTDDAVQPKQKGIGRGR
eukprot:GHVR01192560.1.p1 GENE.GHVR01192560.1~~GHVR01192560.1.p1  ORF type:complete len:412 (-),score=85.46 GHVR01192560.1:124-1359(-)